MRIHAIQKSGAVFCLKDAAGFAVERIAVSYALSAAQKWSDDEIERLVEWIETGATLEELASRLGRSEKEVQEYGSYLGLLLPEHTAKMVGSLELSTDVRNRSIYCASVLTAGGRG